MHGGVDESRPDWWTSDEWATPPVVFQRLADIYGPFDLDPCCRTENAKSAQYFTKDTDGLSQQWSGTVWVNPPYSNPRPWIQKAIDSAAIPPCKVVMLLPGAIDTGWFHDLVLPHADLVFVRGRIKFIGWKGTPIGAPKQGNLLALFPKGSRSYNVSSRQYAT